MIRVAVSSPSRHRGQAFFLTVLLLVIGISALIYSLASPSRINLERDRVTSEALAQAKAALIGHAVAMNDSDLTGGARPGDLPCPDLNDSGAFGSSCNNQSERIGRLPWKSLGLPDLRDGDGERLWYAVSTNFKSSTRTICASPGTAGCLNSDTAGTITIRASDGTVVNNGNDTYASTSPTGVVAAVFAPGAILRRQGAGSAQDRSCTGGTCTSAGVCNSPVTNVAKCNPVNYLDIQTGVEDNASFTDSSSTDGFINGVIRDASGNLIVNDRLITITVDDLMPVVQRRVAKEVLNCLSLYAAVPQNKGRYPWPASITDVTVPYGDQASERFGRVPDGPLSDTLLGLGGSLITTVCGLLPGLCMSSTWPVACGITLGTWWTNWREMVFYGIAAPYQPSVTGALFPLLTASVPTPTGCGTCLSVSPSSASDKKVVVVVAGRRLSGQSLRTGSNRTTATNYVEGTNDNTSGGQNTYEQQTTSTSFNDTVMYLQE